MGCSTYIYLPGNVRVRDVASVMGAIMGCPKRFENFSSGSDGYTKVDNVEVESTGCPELAYIKIKNRVAYYHFETFEDNKRLVSTNSTSFWNVVGRRLVDFFGGYVDYNDCDETEVDYVVASKPISVNAPSDGDEWYVLQDRILNITPIHKDDFTPDDGYDYQFDMMDI